ncbi:hypothetical protein NDU88_001553 [Pleurodeles waltl]|uniref:Uncharacterized protein n=1 Tax=Pleurodeles waltl TaxID=8319 RepID=A0AAV7R9E6_PLEWA|nr:hypothetical protein NDU88_001553 [Pleurodeles waltl]
MGKPSRRRETDSTRDISDSTPPEQEVVRKSPSGDERTPKEPTLQDVMQAITASRTALEEKIDSLALDFSVLRDDHRRLAERMTFAEKQMKELGPEIQGTSKILRQMEKRIKDLELRCARERDTNTALRFSFSPYNIAPKRARSEPDAPLTEVEFCCLSELWKMAKAHGEDWALQKLTEGPEKDQQTVAAVPL